VLLFYFLIKLAGWPNQQIWVGSSWEDAKVCQKSLF